MTSVEDNVIEGMHDDGDDDKAVCCLHRTFFPHFE